MLTINVQAVNMWLYCNWIYFLFCFWQYLVYLRRRNEELEQTTKEAREHCFKLEMFFKVLKKKILWHAENQHLAVLNI